MVEASGVQGEFRLLHKIGEGGMADVFLAERMGDDGFKTRVALKRLHRGLAMDSYFIRQLVREARLLGQLEHANIVKVFDLRRIGDEHYVVMEYVDGIDLAAVIKVHRNRKTRIPRPFFLHVALSLSEALSYAHAAVDEQENPTPLIHRDIKPSNVMLSRRGTVKLTDFGIAHVGDGSVTGGLVQGTANYMSPEQAFGEERLTPASDVYSLGAVFFEMLTGRPNVDGDNYLKAIHQVRERRVTLDELAGLGVEPGLRMVIAKMLSADMNGRYQEMESVRNDLQFVAERLKIDLSWHRIRAYVGRLMGILGRAPDRATLSNLQVPQQIQEAAKKIVAGQPPSGAITPPTGQPVAGPATGPATPATPPPTPRQRLKRSEDAPVTHAVQKDLIDSIVGPGPVPLGGADGIPTPVTPAIPMPAVRPGVPPSYQGDTVSVVRPSGGHPGDDPLMGAPPSRPPVLSPATGAVPVPPDRPVPRPPASSAREAQVAGPEGWDDEATRVYTGKSPAESGVMGTGQMAALQGTPSNVTIPMPLGSQSLKPAGALVDLAEPTVPPAARGRPPTGSPMSAATTRAIRSGAGPGSAIDIPTVPPPGNGAGAAPAVAPAEPAPAPRPPPGGLPTGDEEETDTETWVFSDSLADDDLAAPAPIAPPRRRPDGQRRRRRRRRRKSSPVSPLVATLLVLAILFLLCAVLVAIAVKQDLIGANEEPPSSEICPCPGAELA